MPTVSAYITETLKKTNKNNGGGLDRSSVCSWNSRAAPKSLIISHSGAFHCSSKCKNGVEKQNSLWTLRSLSSADSDCAISSAPPPKWLLHKDSGKSLPKDFRSYYKTQLLIWKRKHWNMKCSSGGDPLHMQLLHNSVNRREQVEASGNALSIYSLKYCSCKHINSSDYKWTYTSISNRKYQQDKQLIYSIITTVSF